MSVSDSKEPHGCNPYERLQDLGITLGPIPTPIANYVPAVQEGSFLYLLGRVRRIVKILGMVNAIPLFDNHPGVINGCSDLLVSVFGEVIGRHARSAVGVASLAGQITVEIEMIVAIH